MCTCTQVVDTKPKTMQKRLQLCEKRRIRLWIKWKYQHLIESKTRKWRQLTESKIGRVRHSWACFRSLSITETFGFYFVSYLVRNLLGSEFWPIKVMFRYSRLYDATSCLTFVATFDATSVQMPSLPVFPKETNLANPGNFLQLFCVTSHIGGF